MSLAEFIERAPQLFYPLIGAGVLLTVLLLGFGIWALTTRIRRNLARPDPLLPEYVRYASNGREKVPKRLMLARLMNFGKPVEEGTWLFRLQTRIDKRLMKNEVRKNDEWLDRIKELVEEAKAASAAQATPNKSRHYSVSFSRPMSLFGGLGISISSIHCPRSQPSPRSPSFSEKGTSSPSRSPADPGRMSPDWEVEHLRMSNALLASGQPMLWTTYVPAQPLLTVTAAEETTLAVPALCHVKDGFAHLPQSTPPRTAERAPGCDLTRRASYYSNDWSACFPNVTVEPATYRSGVPRQSPLYKVGRTAATARNADNCDDKENIGTTVASDPDQEARP